MSAHENADLHFISGENHHENELIWCSNHMKSLVSELVIDWINFYLYDVLWCPTFPGACFMIFVQKAVKFPWNCAHFGCFWWLSSSFRCETKHNWSPITNYAQGSLVLIWNNKILAISVISETAIRVLGIAFSTKSCENQKLFEK